MCRDRITFGGHVIRSWNTLIMDSDQYSTENTITKEIYPQNSRILIGDKCRNCARSVILKGSQMSSDSILSSASVFTKKYDEENVLLAGSTAVVKKHNITLK